ncbi:hypothetical protein [Nocardioides sp. SYSU D00038]|uniref:hypothetical protein n=1 Tax=Nocardioides sp. SYSU D00038 TaxID=2812554 RepID=UPI0019687AB2|nr:hypothetical protein [Nocardioides sp. SYSU D00038]
MNPLSTLVHGVTHGVTTVARVPLVVAARGVGLARGLADVAAGRHDQADPEATPAPEAIPTKTPEAATDTADREPEVVLAEPPSPAEAAAAAVAREQSEPDLNRPSISVQPTGGPDDDLVTPAGTPAADLATNPDTTDTDLHQVDTEDVVTPATVARVVSESQTLSRAADPDKG